MSERRRRLVPTSSPGPSFWPLGEVPLVVCEVCMATIPSTDRARATHQRWHEANGKGGEG